MAHKKIVFVIVEGPSDDEALSVLLEKIYDKNRVYVHITHGDITTAAGANSSNILKKIGEMVKGYARSNHLTTQHFQEIVHILDTDGAYIPEDAICEDPTADKPVYSSAAIRTKDPTGIIKRNKTKRMCLDRISITKKVSGIPYQAYYMSSNLDHVLYDIQNPSDEEKRRNSLDFARKYRDDINGFLDFISNSDFSVTSEYVESWAYIKEKLHSLERHSNLGLCFKRAAAKSRRP